MNSSQSFTGVIMGEEKGMEVKDSDNIRQEA
jgi:hypothetical protein